MLAWYGLRPTHRHTHTSSTLTELLNGPGFVQMGHYSDVQLYSEGSSTLTALSGQLKATTSPCVENTQGSIITHVTESKAESK